MHMNVGPVLTLLQLMGGQQRRALAHAYSLLVTNIVALPLGPLFVGAMSDWLSPLLGTQALGLAILILLVTSWSLSAWLFGRTARHLATATPNTVPQLAGHDGLGKAVTN
jgi:hypothetical protein